MTDDSIHFYDYTLPPELIAQTPSELRDGSRLLHLDKKTGNVAHQQFTVLPQFLRPHDLLIVNNTRVVPARLQGIRTNTGGKWEGLFLREEESRRWRIIGSTRGKLQQGETITLSPAGHQVAGTTLELKLLERHESEWVVQPLSSVDTLTLLEQFGTMPLPPYMQREAEESDWTRYQTTYAKRAGAVAAPTAGLHFTEDVMQACQDVGASFADVTLHVGIGTFRPVSVERLSEHEMHYEWCELPEETVNKIQHTREMGGRVIAVGTTSVRTLESVCHSGPLRAWQGDTNLFIQPPWNFQVVDGLITNFHLPKSTLLVLVSALAGRENILNAYQQAICEEYRFYSYGDAMLII